MKPINCLKRLTKNEILNSAEFVVKENINHHFENQLSKGCCEDILSINKEEERFYDSSQIYVVKTNLNEIQDAIKILK